MKSGFRMVLAALLFAGGITVPCASVFAQDEEKVQKITFVEDDAQKTMASKIYVLKHTKAADILPFVKEAVLRYTGASNVSSVNDTANNRQMIIVSTGENLFKYVDDIVAALDRDAEMHNGNSNILGDGIAIGFYRPEYRAAESMKEVVVNGQVFGGDQDGLVMFDEANSLFYFKDAPSIVGDIKTKLSWFDREIPQTRLEMTLYEVRDSDLKDIGIDYLAWKNGPGLNLFGVAYDALTMKAGETLINTIASSGIDLFGSFHYGFGGFYTAPAFDMSFIRVLQQNGKATISSTADVTVSNRKGKNGVYGVSFAPEYQNITKDENHRSNVTGSSDSKLTATINNVLITSGEKGTVNFGITLESTNVVERNNMGAEIANQTAVSVFASLARNQEKVLCSWSRSSTVEQTIGVPVLCELPVLKYIFGTTTENVESTHYFVTVKAVPVVALDQVESGIVAELDELCRK